MDLYQMRQQVETWREAARALPDRPLWADDATSYIGDGAQSPLRAELARLEDVLPDCVRSVRGAGSLILGVGGTHQSILLSIAAHRPRHLVLVARKDETGRDFLDRLRDALDCLPPDLIRHEQIETVEHDTTDPVRLFFELSRRLQALPRPVSIDITSGSKDMASIAFQLAVDAEDADVSAVYMQGRYLPELGVPVPGTAAFAQIADPRLALALHDRRRVESLWQSAEHAEAARLLGDLVARLQQAAPGEGEIVQRWRSLHALAQGLWAWSEARYDEVDAHFGDAGEQVPAFIQPLTRLWGGLPGEAEAREAAIKAEPEAHFRQLVDDWVWLGRQAGRDPRLRLLRYFSLGESAMEGLVGALLRLGEEHFEVLHEGISPAAWVTTTTLPREVRKADMKRAALLVGDPNGLLVTRKGADGETVLRAWYRARDIRLLEAAPWLDMGEDSWRKIRNACTHSVGGLPDPNLLDDYRQFSLAAILACVRVHPTISGLHDELAAWARSGGWNPGQVRDRLRP